MSRYSGNLKCLWVFIILLLLQYPHYPFSPYTVIPHVQSFSLPLTVPAPAASGRFTSQYKSTTRSSLVTLHISTTPSSSTVSSSSKDEEPTIMHEKKLFPFQKEGVKRLVNSKRLLLADEMGLGKTVQCIAAINHIRQQHPKSMNILIICPKSLLGVWRDELDTWLATPPNMEIFIATPKAFPYETNLQGTITLINYDICHKFRDVLSKDKYDIVICDEAHYLKSMTAKRTQAVLDIPSDYLWLLTGTPILNRPIELYPLLHAINSTEFNSFSKFAKRYCDPKKKYYNGKYSTDYTGASHLQELSQRIEPFMLRRYKMDVLTQLPPKVRSLICLSSPSYFSSRKKRKKNMDGEDNNEDPPEDMAQWERARLLERLAPEALNSSSLSPTSFENINTTSELSISSSSSISLDNTTLYNPLEEFGSHASNIFSYISNIPPFVLQKYTYDQIMGSLMAVRKDTALAKLKPAIELLENVILSQKVVVFAHHRDLIFELTDHFGYNQRAVCLLGGMDTSTRMDAVRRFQTDPNIRLFVGSIRTAGVGLTLTAASHVVFLELDWSPGVMSQAEDRCHRVGQRNSVQIHYYVFKDTIDERIAKSLLYKQSNIDQILPEHEHTKYDNDDLGETFGDYWVEPGYIFDFGKHAGQRLENVPQNYIRYLLRNKVWRNRPSLGKALAKHGYVLEEAEADSTSVAVAATTIDSDSTTTQYKHPTTRRQTKKAPSFDMKSSSDDNDNQSNCFLDASSKDVDYIFDFGRYNGKKWKDVPRGYLDWLIREKVWENIPNLKTALMNSIKA